MVNKKLVIIFVIDMYDWGNNGTTMTARRTADYLRKQGHQVKILSTGIPENNKFVVPRRYIPIVSTVAKKQNFIFGKPEKGVIRQAFSQADIAHFFLPFELEIQAMEIAQEMHLPHCAAFHLQPENMIYNLQPKNSNILSDYLYRRFRNRFYNGFDHIHCPSQFIASQLVKRDYRSKLHVISNGIPDTFSPLINQGSNTDSKFHILSVGRLAPEKRQDILIEAVNGSKYRDSIQLHFAGYGPERSRLIKLGQKLPLSPTFDYYSQPDLVSLIHTCKLYVHPSDIEIEAISCLEAIACGLVPVISNSVKSAAPQFALDERSLFEAGDYVDLAHKIDYWIEHADERNRMSARYAESAHAYSIESSARKLEAMFYEVIEDAK